MLQIFQLLLPAIIPSWRFFESISPSPRIEYTLLENKNSLAKTWHMFRPKPEKLTVADLIRHMFFNAKSNETLFLTSCAERLIHHPTEHSVNEIIEHIQQDLKNDICAAENNRYVQFRLMFIHREGTTLHTDILYMSQIYLLKEGDFA